MKYVATTIESPRGLSQEQALLALYDHPKFKAGTKIASVRQLGDRWVIKALEPKTAEFPPSEDDDDDESPAPEEAPEESGDESGDDSGDDSEDSGDSPFPPKGDSEGGPEGKPEKPSVETQLAEITSILHQVTQALGIGGPDAGLGPEGPIDGPPGPPPPPEHGHGGARPGAGHPPGPSGPAAKPVHDIPPGASPIAGFASVREASQHVPSFKVSSENTFESLSQAATDLTDVYGPHYKVKQARWIDHKGGRVSALLSVR